MTKHAENYTTEQVKQMTAMYKAAKTDEERKTAVETLAKNMGKTVSSIRMKLVNEKIYIKAQKVSAKTGKRVVSKATLIKQLCENTGKSGHFFRSLETVTKDVLEFFVDKTSVNKESEESEEKEAS